MRRFATTTLKTAVDLLALTLVWVLAWSLRFDWAVPDAEWHHLILILPYVVALQYGCLATFVVHRFAWSYVGLREVTRIFYALAIALALLLGMRLVSPLLYPRFSAAQHSSISIGILLIDFVLACFAISGLRILRRLWHERTGKSGPQEAPLVRTLLVGAGAAGVAVVKEVASRPELGIEAVGFVDDDPLKIGTMVHGVGVLGTMTDLRRVCADARAEQVLITIANATGKDIRRIVKLCEDADVPAKIIPSLHEIVGGRVNLSRVRDVAIEDLLRREPVTLDEAEIKDAVANQVVLVTGAGGSIGSELCRQICRFKPAKLLLVERAENNLFEIHRELSASFPEVATIPLIADVTDAPRIDAVFTEHRPSMVLHAAAHKHVPLMEWNVPEAIKNNVFGTKCLADTADRHHVSRFVMISTDKAVNPSSIMGASKRISEIYLQAMARRSSTKFINVRFGNVLGSAGSVVPIFQRQIARGGPVLVTHPEMKRYFMTIPEATQLVLQAATMGAGGEIFILDMGEPVKIVDLASDLIRLSGFRPGEDIEIQFTGVRPGEKLFEELSLEHENVDKTRHAKIFVGRLSPYPWQRVEEHMTHLWELAQEGDEHGLRDRIGEVVPEYRCPDAEPGRLDSARPAEVRSDPTPLAPTLTPSRAG